MKKTHLSVLGLVAIGLLSFSLTTLAATTTVKQIKATSSKATSTKATSTAAQLKVQACANWKTKLETIQARHGNNVKRDEAVFSNIMQKISDLIIRLEANGVNVSKLKADAGLLQQKINKFVSDKDIYFSKLVYISKMACNPDDNNFKAELKSMRSALQAVHKDIIDIRNFYQTVIRKDILDLRKSLKGSASSTDSLLKASTTIKTGNAGLGGSVKKATTTSAE